MLWEIVVGVFGAIALLVTASFLITGLTELYKRLLEKIVGGRWGDADLIAVFSRFAAVVTIALVLVAMLFGYLGATMACMPDVARAESQD
jgi:uncharacterized BrkB/YihY/UPF0761 family membrane protein